MKLLITLSLLLSFQIFAAIEYNYPYYDRQEGQDNRLQILNSGIGSFAKRVQMIRRAKKTIEIEYFIYRTDLTSRLLTQELLKKAREGVKVRLLLDASFTVLQWDEYIVQAASLASKGNFEVRYYNTAPLLYISSNQFRSHRKLIVVDDKEAMTGGRNIGDEYFDLHHEYNFLDRDIYVKGPMAKTMKDSFDGHWNHKITKKVKFPSKPQEHQFYSNVGGKSPSFNKFQFEKAVKKHDERIASANELMTVSKEQSSKLNAIMKLGEEKLTREASSNCQDLTYIADLPGGRFTSRIIPGYRERYRRVDYLLSTLIHSIPKNGELLVDSPYLLMNDGAKDLFDEMLEKNIKVTALTNSLGSTDAFYVASNFYRKAPKWAEKGAHIYQYDSYRDPSDKLLTKDLEASRWGVHSKTFVFDDNAFFIGTYNVDNRSSFYNNEMGLVCSGNDKLTENVRENIQNRINRSYKIIGKEKAIDKNGKPADYYGNANRKQIKTMKLFSPLAAAFESLM
jgi:putative cardiolipin synthase